MKVSRKSALLVASVFTMIAAGSIQNAIAGDSDMQKKPSTTAGAYLGDSAITAKVKAAIVAEPDLSALEIKVNTSDGVVTLTGTVDTQQKIERAAQVAQTIDGVKTVDNQLSLKAPS